MFIIQAHRGRKHDPGVEFDPTDSAEDVDSSEESDTDSTDGDENKLPVEADFVIAYCTVPGTWVTECCY